MKTVTFRLVNTNDKILKQLYKRDCFNLGVYLKPYQDNTKIKTFCIGYDSYGEDLPESYQDEPIGDIPDDMIGPFLEVNTITVDIKRVHNDETGLFEIVAEATYDFYTKQEMKERRLHNEEKIRETEHNNKVAIVAIYVLVASLIFLIIGIPICVVCSLIFKDFNPTWFFVLDGIVFISSLIISYIYDNK